MGFVSRATSLPVALGHRSLAIAQAPQPYQTERRQVCELEVEPPMPRIIATIGLLVAAVLFLYWLGAFDLPISIARWWIGGHGRR
jgi:hypothetical protein